MEFGKRGWRKHEPGRIRADRANRFETLLDGAIVEREYTLGTLAEVAGVREDELRHRLALAMGFIDDDADDEEPAAARHRLRLIR